MNGTQSASQAEQAALLAKQTKNAINALNTLKLTADELWIQSLKAADRGYRIDEEEDQHKLQRKRSNKTSKSRKESQVAENRVNQITGIGDQDDVTEEAVLQCFQKLQHAVEVMEKSKESLEGSVAAPYLSTSPIETDRLREERDRLKQVGTAYGILYHSLHRDILLPIL
jgi:hydroxymethylpyrimidine pyrophosphatase-like HAD family hydrolase